VDILLVAGLIAIVLLLAFLVFRLWRPRDTLLGQQLLDLKNELGALKTRQLEAQSEALRRQGELFNQSQKVMVEQLHLILGNVSDNLSRTQQNINQQLSSTGKVVQDIESRLGALGETTRQIKEIGRDISSLQDILQAPKLRGNLGEYLLEDLLKQIFPAKNYEMKYSFRDQTQVDAVIRLGDGLIPIDAKFPLESFGRLVRAEGDEAKKKAKREFVRSVRERIDEIAGKYIKPDEGTFDFALIYIPAENVFYETVIMDSLADKGYEIFNYAVERHVIPVSPNSFYAYLMAIVFGLKGFRVEQQAKQIIGELSRIQESFSRFYGDFTLVGKHLANAQGKYEESLKRAERFQEQVGRLAGAGEVVESPPALSDPR